MGWDVMPTEFVKIITVELLEKQKAFALQCLSNITILAPVDTGRYRANNIISVGEPDESFDEDKFDPDNQSTFEAGQQVLNAIPAGTYPLIYIQNNLPYCEALEYGHSKKAPQGVYGLSFEQAEESFK